jgi:hypothetical protein
MEVIDYNNEHKSTNLDKLQTGNICERLKKEEINLQKPNNSKNNVLN